MQTNMLAIHLCVIIVVGRHSIEVLEFKVFIRSKCVYIFTIKNTKVYF